ncbi:unnamed protein product [Trichobilharzia szidati]|nr:unnamed protein product [Trichobilharzia szidati]
MNTEIIREQEKLPLNNNIVGDTHTSFQLISHLYQSSSVSMKTLHLNKISDTIGFSISYNNNSDMFHLRDSVSPTSSASSPSSTSPSSSSTSESPRSSSVGSDSETDEDDDVTRTETTPSDSINPLSWSFTFSINNDLERSSYFLPINENNDSIFVGDNNNNNTVIKGSPKDISIWRDLFDTTLKQIKLNTECQHFMLAVLQISLHKVCPSDSPYYMNQTIQISRRHYELINTCLSELLHLNEKSISRQQEQAQPSDKNNNKGTTTTNSDNNNNNNNSDNIVITLQLGFQLISNDDLSSTTIFPPTFSSSPPPSHPVDPHAPAADEAGISQTTSTSTPTPRKDEL